MQKKINLVNLYICFLPHHHSAQNSVSAQQQPCKGQAVRQKEQANKSIEDNGLEGFDSVQNSTVHDHDRIECNPNQLDQEAEFYSVRAYSHNSILRTGILMRFIADHRHEPGFPTPKETLQPTTPQQRLLFKRTSMVIDHSALPSQVNPMQFISLPSDQLCLCNRNCWVISLFPRYPYKLPSVVHKDCGKKGLFC